MFKFISRILKKMFSYPLWAYGLECSICKMSLISPQAHIDHVLETGTLFKHQDKIPKL